MNVKVVLGCTAALVAGLVGALQWGASDGSAETPELVGQSVSEELLSDPGSLAGIEGDGPGRLETVQADAAEVARVEPAKADLGIVGLMESLPPGTLDVWVVADDEQPMVGAKVLISDATNIFTGWSPPSLPEDAARQVQSVGTGTGPGALAPVRFEGLATGDWFVQVTSPRGSTRTKSARLDAMSGTTIIVRFGSARVFGRVANPNAGGTPIPGAYLTLAAKQGEFPFTDDQRAFLTPLEVKLSLGHSDHALTDQGGKFSFDELAAGSYRLSLNGAVVGAEDPADRKIPERFLRVTVAPGEELRVDFPIGLGQGGAVWRGRVVDALGQPIRTSNFWARSSKVRVASWDAEMLERPATFQGRGDANFDERTQYGLDGTFVLRLPAGSYDVWISSPHLDKMIHVVEAKDLRLEPGATLTRDLVLPGITLRGTVDRRLDESAQAWASRMSQGAQISSVSARPGHVTHPAGVLQGPIDATGQFTFYGLQPGDWIFSGFRGGARAELTIPEGASEASVVLMPK